MGGDSSLEVVEALHGIPVLQRSSLSSRRAVQREVV